MYSESRFKCTVNCTSCKSPKDLIYNRLPEFTFTIAGIAFLASTISSIVQSTTSGSVFEEWYFLVMITFYLVMPVFTTWFCIIFIEWHRKVYENIHTEINKLIESEIKRSENEPNKSVVHKLLNNCLSLTAVVDSKITDKDYLRNLNKYSDQIQDIFSQLSQGVLKYALGINMLVFLATSTFSAYRMLTDVSYIYYIFPLSVAVVHICIICARCSDLMDVHGDVLAELKKLLHHYEEQKNNKTDQEEENNKTDRKKKSKKHINDLHKLRANLYDSPPQVVILGSFVVDYGMLSTIIGFILSYALVINELFEEDTLICNAASITTATSTAAVTNSTPPSVATTTPINYTDPDPLSGGAIAGIVIGSIAGVGLIVGSVAFCYIKKKLCFNKLPA